MCQVLANAWGGLLAPQALGSRLLYAKERFVAVRGEIAMGPSVGGKGNIRCRKTYPFLVIYRQVWLYPRVSTSDSSSNNYLSRRASIGLVLPQIRREDLYLLGADGTFI